jgi:HK97 family phage prohead protease
VTEIQVPRREPVELRAAQVVEGGVDFTERTIELIFVPYDEETVVPWKDGIIRESVAPGAFAGIETRNDHVTANRDHDYTRTVGKVFDYRHDDPRGPIGKIRVSQTPLGDETLQLAADGVLKASVGMVVRRSDQVVRDGLRRIKRAFLDHIALVPNPAYQGAAVLSVRNGSSAHVEEKPTPNLDAILALLEED